MDKTCQERMFDPLSSLTVTLDEVTECSDRADWSYEAAVDLDAAVTVVTNLLRHTHITIPTTPTYPKRNP